MMNDQDDLHPQTGLQVSERLDLVFQILQITICCLENGSHVAPKDRTQSVKRLKFKIKTTET